MIASHAEDRGDALQTAIATLLEGLTDAEAAVVRSWLRARHGADAHTDGIDPRALRRDHERVAYRPRRPRHDDPRAIRSIGVIGGGSAGYLSALALRTRRPWLDVTLIESPQVPIIGVGEATVPTIVLFLHHYLGIDPQELYARVRPTWKLGIRFEWGPDPAGFMAPFDWGTHTVGVLGSLSTQHNINAFTFQSLLMAAERTPVFNPNGVILSLMDQLPFAYHLDNGPFVSYLAELARRRGVHHVAAEIDDAPRFDDEWIDHLRTTDGRRLQFDLYIDCSGFRSLLLGKALGTGFRSYASSLFTDAAVTCSLPHGGRLKPHTTATTMNAGWCWNIPLRDSDHLGYVFSSAAMTVDEAADELARRFPDATGTRLVRFRVGRHERAWRGNVIAVGNAYAFVEPLQSTGLLMIASTVGMLANLLPASWSDPVPREAVNAGLAAKWDALRWFLSIHYRFNRRLDTPFWREAQARTDVSGAQPLLEVYASGAPLRLRDQLTRGMLEGSAPPFYWLSGVDCVLLGQQVPTRLLTPIDPLAEWQARKAAADALVARGLPQQQALAAYQAEPHLNDRLLRGQGSWASPAAAGSRLGFACLPPAS